MITFGHRFKQLPVLHLKLSCTPSTGGYTKWSASSTPKWCRIASLNVSVRRCSFQHKLIGGNSVSRRRKVFVTRSCQPQCKYVAPPGDFRVDRVLFHLSSSFSVSCIMLLIIFKFALFPFVFLNYLFALGVFPTMFFASLLSDVSGDILSSV